MKEEQVKLIDEAIEAVENLMLTFDVLDSGQLPTLQRAERVREILRTIKHDSRAETISHVNPIS